MNDNNPKNGQKKAKQGQSPVAINPLLRERLVHAATATHGAVVLVNEWAKIETC